MVTDSRSGVLPVLRTSVLRMPPAAWLLMASAVLAAGLAVRSGVRQMIAWAVLRPEYGHAALIPAIVAFLIWQRRDRLERLPFSGSWIGFAVALLGMLLALLGTLATIYTLEDYSLIVTVLGLVLALTGWTVFRLIAVPLLTLGFMVPLPEFLYTNFSAQLQLLSSRIGVWFMRLCGVTVYLEGNVIDLGAFKLQVAEACDGLRYLFPLMTTGFLIAYFFQASFWKRSFIFLSSIPITILMNSLRVGMIGIMAEHWGVRMAEGFLHEFQGWLMFMAGASLMLLEVVLLAHRGSARHTWRLQFGLDLPGGSPTEALRVERVLPASFFVTAGALILAAAATLSVPPKVEVVPQRRDFSQFPEQLGVWAGRRVALEPEYANWLKLDDYYLGDFVGDGKTPVNLYVAWYNSQSAGRSTHSPRTCIPAGGWQIQSLSQRELPSIHIGTEALRVNRVLIRRGSRRTLVYYWFQQRGRFITNEYLVKWYLFLDSLFEDRTDGALIRLVVAVPSNGSIDAADRELTDFAGTLAGALDPFVPN